MYRFIVVTWLLVCGVSVAGVEYHQFSDERQEQTYTKLIAELRCLVCQNQSIADSNADLAKDLRRQVYEMLQQGQTRQDVIGFMTERYGDFVVYRPPFTVKTWVLWLGPPIFVVTGLLALFLITRRKRNLPDVQVLTAEKKARINALLDEGQDS